MSGAAEHIPLDKAIASLSARIPAAWRFSFLSESDGVWQLVVESLGEEARHQAGTGATVSAALDALLERLTSGDAGAFPLGDVNTHPTIRVRVGEEEADIDELIAPVIESLWQLGIRTQSSCQGGRGTRAHITFPDPEDAAAFLNIIGSEFDPAIDSLWNRAARDDEPDDWTSYRAQEVWRFSADAFDHSVEEIDGVSSRSGPAADFWFNITVAFPGADVAPVANRLRQERERREQLGTESRLPPPESDSTDAVS